MGKAINDATQQKAGDIYQYLIALRDCFALNEGDTLHIETHGDISIINNIGGLFQKEVKHHFSNNTLSERDEDFWKTLANWYDEYERVKNFTHFILSTTAKISNNSSFYGWNSINKIEKLSRLKKIGAMQKKKEKTFRLQYNRIFNVSYDEKHLLDILDKFIIESAQTSLVGISNEFSKYIGYIPSENRDGYIGALLGEILLKVKNPPHIWEVTRAEFDQLIQIIAPLFVAKGTVPLPNDYAIAEIPAAKAKELEQKKFVEAIREIKYSHPQITDAILDYWRADMTVARYFQDNLMYLKSLDSYIEDLSSKMHYTKENSELEADGETIEKKIKISKQLYNKVMSWDAKDFGSIIRNQGFFQRGIIHNIVDETDFNWKVGEDNECI